MKKIIIAIIGMGPRGLSVLERINAIYKTKDLHQAIELHLIDPRVHGQGIHTSEQSDHILINTVACQLTMFSDASVTDAGPIAPNLSILDWARQNCYRELNGKYFHLGSNDCNEIDADAYLPRNMLGAYLSWVYREQLRELTKRIKVIRHQQIAHNITLQDDGRHIISLANGYSFLADKTFITTGHGENAPSPQDQAYAQFAQEAAQRNPRAHFMRNASAATSLHSINSEATIAIEGIGLTAYDLISQFTEGRSGRFTPRPDGSLLYHPSGEEPHILIYSRYGLPFASRGINQKGVQGQYKAQFFTTHTIDQLRQHARETLGHHQLDFEQDLLPILLKEMCYVYRCTSDRHWHIAGDYEPSPADMAAVERIFFGYLPEFESFADFNAFARDYLKTDIDAAMQGNLDGVVKATTDVLRDIRDILRYAVDYAGLTPTSHKIFIEKYCSIMNRIAVGPPLVRNKQLLALLEAGIVEFAAGPKARVEPNPATGRFDIISEFCKETHQSSADVLARARMDVFYPTQDKSTFISNLLSNGLIRPFRNGSYHPSGICIDQRHHPISRDGQPIKTIWALGNIVEGANFYTYVLPRPGVNSRAIKDAGSCVLELFEQLEQLPSSKTTPAKESLYEF